MAKKTKQPSQKEVKKTLLKEVENKLAETLKGYYKKISDRKFEKEIRKAGKILSKHLTKEQITVVHKEKTKVPKKEKKVAEKEAAS
jgi:hypothetical protein